MLGRPVVGIDDTAEDLRLGVVEAWCMANLF